MSRMKVGKGQGRSSMDYQKGMEVKHLMMMMKVVLPTLKAPGKQALERLCCKLQRSPSWGRRSRVFLYTQAHSGNSISSPAFPAPLMCQVDHVGVGLWLREARAPRYAEKIGRDCAENSVLWSNIVNMLCE
jgi:hypothetical protein